MHAQMASSMGAQGSVIQGQRTYCSGPEVSNASAALPGQVERSASAGWPAVLSPQGQGQAGEGCEGAMRVHTPTHRASCASCDPASSDSWILLGMLQERGAGDRSTDCPNCGAPLRPPAPSHVRTPCYPSGRIASVVCRRRTARTALAPPEAPGQTAGGRVARCAHCTAIWRLAGRRAARDERAGVRGRAVDEGERGGVTTRTASSV